MATYLSGAKEAWRVIHQGMPVTPDRKTPQAAIDAAVKAYPNIKIDNEYWDNETLEFVPLSHLHERKANPAPRKRAAKKSTPKSFDQFTKRQLQDFITGCHNARDYGPEFTAACYALNSRPVAARKANPATRKRAISRPSQVTKKAPTKRLVARRKAAAKKPVKGYFPNPVAITAPGPSRKTHEDLPHLFPQPGGAYMISFWRESTKKWVPATLEYSITAAKKWLEYQGYKKAVLLK